MTNDEQFGQDFDVDLSAPRPAKVAPIQPGREGWRIIPDVDLVAYYADDLGTPPSISNSGIGVLLKETPLDFAFQNPRLNPDAVERAKETAAMRRGDVVHQLALGKGAGYAVADFADWRTKDAKSFRDNAIADGLTPIKRADFEDAEIMAAAIKDRIDEVLEGAAYQTEVAFMYQEPTPSGPVWVRGLLDVWCEERAVILDPKVTANLYDHNIQRHLINMGWDRQGALYSHGVGMALPDLAGRIRFADLMIKPSAPFTSRLVSTEKAWTYSSLRLCQRAIETFGACLKAGKWPGFGDQVDYVEMPVWESRNRGEA